MHKKIIDLRKKRWHVPGYSKKYANFRLQSLDRLMVYLQQLKIIYRIIIHNWFEHRSITLLISYNTLHYKNL